MNYHLFIYRDLYKTIIKFCTKVFYSLPFEMIQLTQTTSTIHAPKGVGEELPGSANTHREEKKNMKKRPITIDPNVSLGEESLQTGVDIQTITITE